jgi:hypothetical protein
MTWIRKKDQYSNEECTVALQAKHKKCGWYVDSGCSKYMTGDRDKFLTLQEKRYVLSLKFHPHMVTRTQHCQTVMKSFMDLK